MALEIIPTNRGIHTCHNWIIHRTESHPNIEFLVLCVHHQFIPRPEACLYTLTWLSLQSSVLLSCLHWAVPDPHTLLFSLPVSLSFVAACHVFGTSNLAKLSTAMCGFWHSLFSHVPSAQQESIFLLLSAGSVCVLAVSRSVALSAGRGDLCPLHSDPPNLPTAHMDSLTLPCPHTHTHTHTRCLCSLIGDRDLSCGGVRVFQALLHPFRLAPEAHYRFVVPNLTFSLCACSLHITSPWLPWFMGI